MKTVVITGSSRGLGLEMAKEFRRNGNNVIINEPCIENLEKAKATLEEIESEAKVYICSGDITASGDIQKIIDYTVENCGNIDIWINNAGVNQPMKAIWEIEESEIDCLLNIDLRGTVMGSRLAMRQMCKQGFGAIYNVEGYGSNDAMMLGLNMYGTTKRAVTHFTQAFAKESEERKTGIIVGRLSPGIMITEFITKALGNGEKIDLPEKTKKVYNILGDYPDVVAKFLVKNMLENTKNNAHIEWLTSKKAAFRFMTAGFNKRNFFA